MVQAISITCGECGHTAPMDDFAGRPVSGPLPPEQYQCPACNRAWRLALGPAEHRVGAEVKVIPTDPRL